MSLFQKIRDLHKNGLLGNIVAGLFLVVAFFVSLSQIRETQKEVFDDTKINLRISHWQLELGYREALDKIIKEYEVLHPKVRIFQVAVSERFYGQVLNTHLVGGTAPDLMEMGMTNVVAQDQYLARFFEPMSTHIAIPNPYNKGTDLEKVPWRDTFFDGLLGFYRPVLQDYFGVGTSLFTIRVFYNQDLFQKVLGHDRAPGSFGEMLQFCKAIQEYAKKTKLDLVPIAGSSYNSPIFFERYQRSFLSNYEDILDTNLDGGISGLELYQGLKNGTIKWDDPINKNCFSMIRDLAKFFQNGFMAVGREQAAFLFVQGNAAMITSGSWDAESLFRQSKFRVGIFDFPIPGPTEPYGKYVRGKVTEAGTGTASGYGVCRYSKNKDVAIDFLRFLTSRKYNQQFNQDINWIPAVIGAKTAEKLKTFAPDPVGFSASVYWYWGNRGNEVYLGRIAQFVQNEISFETFGKDIVDTMSDSNYGWKRAAQDEYESSRSTVRIQEQLLGILAADKLYIHSLPDYNRRYKEAIIRQVRMYETMEEFRDRFVKGLNSNLEVQ
jgi:raffinose/stachyose/melibiose transport system substrate-binding protein